MPDPIFGQHIDETPSSSETTTELHAILQTSIADFEAQIQAIVTESTATIARLDDELQTMLAESKAKTDAIIAAAQSIKIEEPPRQFYIPEPKPVASSSSLSAGLEVVQQETNTFLEKARAPQQNSLLYMTASDGSLQPVKPSFWGKLYRLREAINAAPPAAITLERPKSP